MPGDMQTFEFEGLVTQLGATSEVANIGIKMTCPDGEILEIEEWLIRLDDTGAGTSVRIRKFNDNDVDLRFLHDATMDNNFAQSAISVNEATTIGILDVGSALPQFIRAGQYIFVSILGTLDATDRLLFRCTYKSRANIATFVAVGSGITLTTTKHELV